MTESKICTCPSGDGSLRWPCPKHPAVEQAGGDERAAFNRWIAEQQLCQGSDISLFKLERNGALVSLHELLRDAYQAGQDRAALAQPSPAQAEAERLEVVGYRIMRAHADKIYQRVDKAAAEYEAGRSALGYMEDIAEAALCLRNRLDDLLAAPVAQAGQVPAAWYYDAPSQAEAAIIDIRGMWGEDDCPTYEDVASALRRLLAAEPGTEVPQAWLDVQAERRRQVEAEGWTPEHDDEHSHGQMARAAACYALAGSSAPNDGTAALLVSLAWPWDEQWWKPSTARRDMVKACALGLAEIERLDRAAATQGGPRDA
ncbi:hypothetical protein T6260_04505 [Pseudomonas aeruginosa]|uniref:hypothetical protein n=1 Tax=Pseudomonas aeruginosa TaxID=287 RepID=UPI001F4A777B|nr:hypothetical protein [Pseudomonas aeruginosa]MED5128982.1 hypothetical protein [Pseudomonas aeruginosa]